MRSDPGSVVIVGTGRGLRLAAALAALAAVAMPGGAQAQLPDAIATLDAAPLIMLHAEGAQIYECRAAADGKFNWVFREPIAILTFEGRTVGRHYAGPPSGSTAPPSTAATAAPSAAPSAVPTAAPTWEHVDGSGVTAKVVGSAPGATAADIPWLKLEVIERRGSGALAGADFVQRINTAGGVLHGSCERAGSLRSVAYAADYLFRRKDR